MVHQITRNIELTLRASNVNDGSVVLENIDLLNTLKIGKCHLLKDATKLLVVY